MTTITSPSKTTPTSPSRRTFAHAMPPTAGTCNMWTGCRATAHRAYLDALANAGQPSFIALRTIIGWPAPNKQNTGKIHGSALGADEVAATKRILGFDPEVSFPAGKPMATRRASGAVLNALAPALPELWGGSADLAESNNTTMEGEPSFIPERFQTKEFPGHPYGRILHFGVREHAMGAILNGIALHGPTRPYGGTFLVFSDYMRPAVRLAAMMGLPVTYVWTHDSIGLGEDGPTHQPVEHLWALRAIPGLDVVRPGDANETAIAWRTILQRGRTAGLCLTRQSLPVFDRSAGNAQALASAEGVARGGYVLADAPSLDVLLVGTGSELQIALAAREVLAHDGIGARVVSMPCLEWFVEQDASYQRSVLPSAVRARVCVEAGISLGWRAIAGEAGECVSLEHFGASAAYQTLYEQFGFTAERVAEAARSSIAKTAKAGADAAGRASGLSSPSVPSPDAASHRGRQLTRAEENKRLHAAGWPPQAAVRDRGGRMTPTAERRKEATPCLPSQHRRPIHRHPTGLRGCLPKA